MPSAWQARPSMCVDMKKQPQRKRPAHPPPVERHNQPTVLHLTVCAQQRSARLDSPVMHELIRAAWLEADSWLVGDYVIMPDHVHLFCVPNTFPPESVKRWVKYWKAIVSRAVADHGPLGGTRSTASEDVLRRRAGSGSPGRGGTRPSSLWQRDCWDTQMRSHDHYVEKLHYVRHNPVRKGLAQDAEDWPHQGCLHVIRW